MTHPTDSVILPGSGTNYGNAENVSVNPPAGFGHIVNTSHLARGRVTPDGYYPTGAKVVEDDVRIITSDWRIPGRLPVYTGAPRPVKRFNATFTPGHFSADIEYATLDFAPDPFDGWSESERPTLDADGTLTVPGAPPGAPSGAVLVLMAPAGGEWGSLPPAPWAHMIPSTAPFYIWLPHMVTERNASNVYWVTSAEVPEPLSYPMSVNIAECFRRTDPFYHYYRPVVDPGIPPLDMMYWVTIYWTDYSRLWLDDQVGEGGYSQYGPVVPDELKMWDWDSNSPTWSYPYSIATFITSLPPPLPMPE